MNVSRAFYQENNSLKFLHSQAVNTCMMKAYLSFYQGGKHKEPPTVLVRQTSTPAENRMIPIDTTKLSAKRDFDQTSTTADVHSEEGSNMGDLSDIEDDLDDDGKILKQMNIFLLQVILMYM